MEEEVLEEKISNFDYKDDFINLTLNEIEERSIGLKRGIEISAFHCPDLIPLIKESFELIVLWSGVMIPFFGYGSEVASSAISESSFNITKNIFFKRNELSAHADVFINKHLKAIVGSTRLCLSDYQNFKEIDLNEKILKANSKDSECSARNLKSILDKNNIVENNIEACVEKSLLPFSQSTECPACKNGHFPSDAHKCITCGKAVHIFIECSSPAPDAQEDYGQARIFKTCETNSLGICNNTKKCYQSKISEAINNGENEILIKNTRELTKKKKYFRK